MTIGCDVEIRYHWVDCVIDCGDVAFEGKSTYICTQHLFKTPDP